MSNKSGTDVISVPKGGGALKGIGEKFSPDLFTGTGNFSVPLELPPGRNGLEPHLTLTYSTGNGNSAFGLGWALGIPCVTRKTSKGVPRYDDTDVFVLSGFEDLVPVTRTTDVTTYRPRTDTMFARIEHVTGPAPRTDYWRVRSRDGSVSVYGTPPPSSAPKDWRDPAAVAHPDEPRRVFTWRLSETTDPFGNRVEFGYERDQVRVDGARQWDQLYLAEVRYVDYGDPEKPLFLVRVKVVREERPDQFSEYRAGFEIRTRERVKEIQVWTDAGARQCVRTYRLSYVTEIHNSLSLLASIQVEGNDGAGRTQKLPPLEFGYGTFEPSRRTFAAVQGSELPPASLGHDAYELVDLFGNGLPDIVHLDGQARYWRNLGGGRFDRPRSMHDAPGVRLADPGVQFMDADGDGRADLVVTAPGHTGYYPLTFEGGWDRRSFRRWPLAPSFDLRDPQVKLVDLDGDGVTDALRCGAQFECYFNHPTKGWHDTRHVERRRLEQFPDVSFTDPRVKWADMTGDGLTDVLLVHDGRLDYWPALGRGDFAPRITMKNPPRFPHGYDPGRIFVGDVDGDGVADVVYVDDRKVILWINHAGNGFGDPIEILGTPPVTDVDAVRLVDLLGTGVPGILWTRAATTSPRETMFFLDFTGGHKPYLMEQIDNNIGARTTISYSPSTRYYLADAGTSRAWQTPLPFPVHVVARVESIDQLSRGKLTTEFDYHHGYWDGAEREFRGFGRVDQRDSESFEAYHDGGTGGASRFNAVDHRFFSPPTETRTWFHLGAVGSAEEWHEPDWSSEYWLGGTAGLERARERDPKIEKLGRAVQRDALRACRGRILRSELFSPDRSSLAERPYTVTEHVHGCRLETAPSDAHDAPAVFFPYSIAECTTEWDRGTEPMVRVKLTGQHDAYGQVQLELDVAVPKDRDPFERAPAKARAFLAKHTRTAYAQRDAPEAFIVDRVAHRTSYEIKDDGLTMPSGLRPSVLDLWEALRSGGVVTKEPLEQTLNHYDGDDFKGLDLEQIGAHGALKRVEQLVLTAGITAESYAEGPPPYLTAHGAAITWTDVYPPEFRDRLPEARPGGYVYHPADDVRIEGLFAATEQRELDLRGLVVAQLDPLGNKTQIAYDGYALLPTKVTDAHNLETRVAYDYRVLQPKSMWDPNGNQTEYGYSPLGLLESVALLGKAGDKGDTTAAPSTSITYAFDMLPVHAHTRRRTHHVQDDPDGRGDFLETREYSDGFGRLLQTRTLAEDTIVGNADFGGEVLPRNQSLNAPVPTQARKADAPNVVVSGWQTFDNKGKVVEKYEPFFSTGWEYLAPSESQRGQKATLEYDARGRTVRTVSPDGSEVLSVFGVPRTLITPEDFAPSPWETYVYDTNDNAGRTHSKDPRALRQTGHWDTPTSTVVDALGRTLETVERNGDEKGDWYTTRYENDIRGNVLIVKDPLERTALRRVYDLANRALRSESLDSGVRRVTFDAAGGVIEERDARGALVLRAHDELHRPTHVWARDSGAQPLSPRECVFYGDADPDVPGEEALRRNLLGKPSRQYDGAGRLAFEAYDFKGNLLEKQRRLVRDEEILTVFDRAPGANGQIEPFRVSWEDPVSDRLLDATGHTTTQRFDALNRLQESVYPADIEGAQAHLETRYNRAGALERVLLDDEVFVDHIAYNAKGQRTLVAYGSRAAGDPGPHLMTRYAYDEKTFRLVRLRTEGLKADTSFEPKGAVLQDIGYEYDLAGNLVALHDRAPDSGVPGSPDQLDREFTYDPLYRLLSATGRECATSLPKPWDPSPRCQDPTKTRQYTQTHAYDPAGNLRELKHGPGATGVAARYFDLTPGTNKLDRMRVGQLAHGYAYDDAGNLIRENTERTFAWDYASRLTAFSVQAGRIPSAYVHYLYDAAGQRVKKLARKQGGEVEVTVYIDGIFEYHRKSDGAAPQEHNTLHVLDGESRIATKRIGIDPDDATPEVKFHLGDHLGSSTVVVDQDGGWISREEYTPYGETSFGGFARKRYRFTGKERDEESGLYYHGARYYAPWLGRWVSTDPKLGKDGWNAYGYVRSNPLRLVDPGGAEAAKPAPAPESVSPPSAVNVTRPVPGSSDNPSATAGGGPAPNPPGTRDPDTPEPLPRSVLQPPPKPAPSQLGLLYDSLIKMANPLLKLLSPPAKPGDPVDIPHKTIRGLLDPKVSADLGRLAPADKLLNVPLKLSVSGELGDNFFDMPLKLNVGGLKLKELGTLHGMSAAIIPPVVSASHSIQASARSFSLPPPIGGAWRSIQASVRSLHAQ